MAGETTSQTFSENFASLSAAGGLVIIALTVAFLAYRDWQIAKTVPDEQSRMPFSAKFLLIVLGGVVFVWMVNSIFSNTSQGTGFATVAGLILLGVAAVIGIMNLLSVSAARIGIIDGRQPFGLPEGSVRAILTMAFIVLVGVLSSFLLTGNQSRSPFADVGMEAATFATRPQADTVAQDLRKIYGADALIELKTTVAADKTETFAVIVHPRIDFTVADDIAKQTLTMISTILAAMIGFYFASRGGGEGADPAVIRRTAAQAELSKLVSDSTADAELDRIGKAIANAKPTAEAKNGAERQPALDALRLAELELSKLQKQWGEAKVVLMTPNPALVDVETSNVNLRSLEGALKRLDKAVAALGVVPK